MSKHAISDSQDLPLPVRRLLDRGVDVRAPRSIEVGSGVDPERIAAGVVVHAGCRLYGDVLSVGPGCVLGAEQPVTLKQCQLAAGVSLAGGYFEGATFLDRAGMGSGAHVRPGTLLEEEANGAHAVGLKQTILLPFVTLGSLINFCDCLMAGGTSRRDHSEVGSSYVHFNFTPHQDKATASLIGDVPQGVMLDRPPIFLGGQGGLVGPVRIAYGTVVAAGGIQRRDQLVEGHLVVPPAPRAGTRAYAARTYGDIYRLVANNLRYIGNLRALEVWYEYARALQSAPDPYHPACLEGARRRIGEGLKERLKRLSQCSEKVLQSLEILQQQEGAAGAVRSQAAFTAAWPRMAEALESLDTRRVAETDRDRCLAGLEAVLPASTWADAVGALDPAARAAGTRWLQAVVDSHVDLWHPITPDRAEP